MTNIPLVIALGLFSTIQLHLAKGMQRQGIEGLSEIQANFKPTPGINFDHHRNLIDTGVQLSIYPATPRVANHLASGEPGIYNHNQRCVPGYRGHFLYETA